MLSKGNLLLEGGQLLIVDFFDKGESILVFLVHKVYGGESVQLLLKCLDFLISYLNLFFIVSLQVFQYLLEIRLLNE